MQQKILVAAACDARLGGAISFRIEWNKNDDTEYQSEFLHLFFPWFSIGTAGEPVDFGTRSSSFIIIQKNLQSQKIMKSEVLGALKCSI
ncbi:MAG: hypothetical protein P8185_13415 [Deltaproteobacteria bacterium]